MKIGIDGRTLTTGRAIARYTRNLLNNLSRIDERHDYFLFVEGEKKIGEFRGLNLSPRWKTVAAPRKVVLRDHFLFHRFLRPFGLDIFFHPDNSEFLFCHPRSVVTIHDAIPYLLPRLSLSRNFTVRLKQELYLALQRQAVARSSFWAITVSENSKRDLIKVFNLPAERISVTPEAVEENFFARSEPEITAVRWTYGLQNDYIFCNSGFSPYKNVPRLIDAFALLSNHFPHLQLALGGSFSYLRGGDEDYYQSLRNQVKNLGLSTRVVFTDYVEEEKLPALYSGAKAFVYPSLYEGFGIPLLEAQACGVPVLATKVASIPEVIGESALLFDPYDITHLAAKLAEVLADDGTRRRWREKGFENVKRFSWEKCARQTLEVFERVYETP